MKKNKKIEIKGIVVSTIIDNKNDFISLTDIAKFKNSGATGLVISHWMSTRFTIEFMGLWEQMHNQKFNVTEFGNIRNQSGSNGFVLTSKQWTERTRAIGVISKPGRYGGTYAHKDIAFEFASWISPEFKLFLIKEFQRLKEIEIERQQLGWDLKRNLAAVNYRIHTDAIKENLIPEKLSKGQTNLIYANEADVLNKALFGLTAKEWRDKNKKQKGNIRDYANAAQLVCLSNLESLNAELINQKIEQPQRLVLLNKIAIKQIKSLLQVASIKKLK